MNQNPSDMWVRAHTTGCHRERAGILRTLILMNECPEDILLGICREFPDMQEHFMYRTCIPDSVCRILCQASHSLRTELALRESTPTDVLLSLRDTHFEHILWNRNCPASVLVEAVQAHLHKSVGLGIIAHKNLPCGYWIPYVWVAGTELFVQSLP